MRNLYCEYPINSPLHLSHDCCGLLKCEEFEDQDAEEASTTKIQTVNANSWTEEEKLGIDLAAEKLKEYLEGIKKLAEKQERIGNAMCDKMIKIADLENL